jgi:S-adenosylmethionine hydrolase
VIPGKADVLLLGETARYRKLKSILAIGVLFASAMAAGCGTKPTAETQPQASPQHPTIVFMTDFGTANDAVAICKAVMLQIVPDVRIMDITHQVTPFSIEDGARYLAAVTPYYPANTVFVVVVDPGVGTSRKAIIAKSKKGQYFDLPDNGLITPVADRDGLEAAREITNRSWMIGAGISSTFHGRDIFSPSGAHLAAGEDWTLVGPEVDVKSLVRLNVAVSTMDAKGITGQVVALDDPFGNLLTDITSDDFKQMGYKIGDKVAVKIDGKPYTVPYAKTFMDVPAGQMLLYVTSRDRVGFALNERDFSKTYKITPPAAVYIPRK